MDTDETAIQAVDTREGPAGHEVGCLAQSFQDRVRPMIDLIDRLRKLGLNKDVNLPTIVVVGDQSAGKSSVLEAISGIQLPRGTGIVTRCPLEIRMKSGKQDTPWRARIHYKDCIEDGDEIIDDIIEPAQVANCISKAQDILAGTDKGISTELISLEVESDGIPDLTVIDLPGICRVPVGDQPMDIADQVKKLIKSYIKRDNTIILAVVPATVDIATTEALQMANEVDPEKKRTIGVITKADLVDKGSEDDLVAAAENRKYPLLKGYYVVRCRGQKDINENLSLEKGLEREWEFFSTAEHFRNLLDHGFVGSKNLSRRLTEELVDHIKVVLPELQEEIKKQLDECQKELTTMGPGLPKDTKQKARFLNKILHEYVDDIRKLARGQEEDYEQDLRVFTNSRTKFEAFSTKLQQVVPGDDFGFGFGIGAASNTYLKEVEKELEGLRGRELPPCISFMVYRKLIIKRLDKIKTPAHDCLAEVERLITGTFTTLSDKHFKGYEELNTFVRRTLYGIFKKSLTKSTDRLDEMLNMEEIIFTQDSEYHQSVETADVQKRNETQGQGAGFNFKPNSSQMVNRESQAKSVYTIIQAYMQICIRRICDTVPMVITQHMILKTADLIAEEIPALLADPMVTERFQERADVVGLRMRLTAKQDRLEMACQELSAVNV